MSTEQKSFVEKGKTQTAGKAEHGSWFRKVWSFLIKLNMPFLSLPHSLGVYSGDMENK